MKKILDFRVAIYVISLILFALLALVTDLYVNSFVSNLELSSELNEWIQFAASTKAQNDYSSNQKAFFELAPSAKSMTIVGYREGYPVKAWTLLLDKEIYNQRFIDCYNAEMEKLIKNDKR